MCNYYRDEGEEKKRNEIECWTIACVPMRDEPYTYY